LVLSVWLHLGLFLVLDTEGVDCLHDPKTVHHLQFSTSVNPQSLSSLHHLPISRLTLLFHAEFGVFVLYFLLEVNDLINILALQLLFDLGQLLCIGKLVHFQDYLVNLLPKVIIPLNNGLFVES
jgi:hypothetical protein